MIPKKNIQDVLDASRIEEVVGDFVNLKKRGANYIGLCPFHNEKTPSFHVSPSRGIFKCFGCGKGGDAITFVKEHEHFTYPEAVRYLAQKYNIKLDEREESSEEKSRQLEQESLYLINQFAQQFYQHNLLETEEGKNAGLSYFKERGFGPAEIEKFHLGYSMNAPDALLEAALKAAYSRELLQKAGLISTRDERSFDFFRHRVMFPVHNLSGKVVAFGGRILIKDDKQPKYVNSPETEIYSKSKLLYGIFQARQAIRKLDEVYLVEGYTDVISMHLAGIENVVASSGTSLTQDQVKLIKRFTPNITILYDGDAAGVKAALRGLEMVLEEDMNVRMVLLPDGEDPDSFVQGRGAIHFRDFVKQNAKNFILFKTDLLLAESANDPVHKARVIREMVDTIARIPDPIKRSLFVKECSARMDIQENLLIHEINQARRKQLTTRNRNEPGQGDYLPPVPEPVADIQNPPRTGPESLERHLLKLLLEFGTLPMAETTTVSQHILQELQQTSLQQPLYEKILGSFRSELEAGHPIDYRFFNAVEDEEIRDLVLDLLSTHYQISENWYNQYEIVVKDREQNYRQDVERTLLSYRMMKMRQMRFELVQRIKDASSDEERTRLQKVYQRVQEELRKAAVERGTTFIGKWQA